MKRAISFLIVLVMVFGLLDVTAFGAAKPSKPAAPKKLIGYSSYNSVALEWNPVKKAKHYLVYRNGKKIAKVSTKSRAYDNKKRMAFLVKNVPHGYQKKTDEYWVVAVNKAGKSKKSNKVKKSAVKPMYIDVTFRGNRTLTSHDGKYVTHTFARGETVHACYYVRGYYYFFYDVGNKPYLFRVYYENVRNYTANYTTARNYKMKEAEYFINTSGQESETPYLLWVSLYTQHIYVLKGKKGKWRLNNSLKADDGRVFTNWEISSGTASTPSPMGLGITFNGKPMNIYKRQVSYQGRRRLWNFFHSESALHGPLNDSYGWPQSGGCVRSPWERAEFIYYKIPLGTRVVMF